MSRPLIGKPKVTKPEGDDRWWVEGTIVLADSTTHYAARAFARWACALAFANQISARRRA